MSLLFGCGYDDLCHGYIVARVFICKVWFGWGFVFKGHVLCVLGNEVGIFVMK